MTATTTSTVLPRRLNTTSEGVSTLPVIAGYASDGEPAVTVFRGASTIKVTATAPTELLVASMTATPRTSPGDSTPDNGAKTRGRRTESSRTQRHSANANEDRPAE